MTMEEIAFEAEIIARLKELQQSNDIQLAHCQADSIICNLLNDLGYTNIAKEYNAIVKRHIVSKD